MLLTGLLAVATAVGVSGLSTPQTASAAPQGCGYADTSANNGENAGTICWFDFANYDNALATSDAGQPVTITLDGGYTASFTVKNRDVSGLGNPGVQGRATPLENRFAFGTDAYRGVPGSPALYSNPARSVLQGLTLSLEDIEVRDKDGAPLTGYSFVAADVEDNVSGESFTWNSDKPIDRLETLAPNGQWGCKDPQGLGTTEVTCDGSGAGSSTTAGGKSTALLVRANAPTTFSTTWRTSRQSGIAFGVQTAKLTLDKNVVARVAPSDSFDTSITSPESTELGSATTGTATTSTTGSTVILPSPDGSPFALSEAASSGSTSLSQYAQSWSCVNRKTDSSTVLPDANSGTSATVVPAVADDIVCTISNTPIPKYSVVKSVDEKQSAVMGQKVTYTVTVANETGLPYTDTNPASFSDDMSNVLDDAAYNNDASNGATFSAGTLSWSGALGANETKTITYSVTVNDPDKGDLLLTNVVSVPPERGGYCKTEGSCTTTTPVRTFNTIKSVDRKSASSGDKVTYTVTVTNTGQADYVDAKPASFTDDLSKVADDATYNGDASNGAQVSGNKLSWSGALAKGETKTITYSFTVNNPDNGDKSLDNVVVPDKTGKCSPLESCTTHTTVVPPPAGPEVHTGGLAVDGGQVWPMVGVAGASLLVLIILFGMTIAGRRRSGDGV
ncbi:isopeptide-forming domain-containing fimbrial protein [Plantibacter sp. VKM Ac-2885]|uniref:DUF7927 domain-containing protein n=1 Tax=Plantibacter sp. VKM Ac-2885 TaxID=2783828 RepID=UPI00188A2DC6|nr:DUF11 domain-containing protein [Plantibacter sp. VKM Ac-2885]MBF4514140.1 isopeptide-forming domain-containing fimbrial protein [Plantibacter sp. VKM Ac-2885]